MPEAVEDLARANATGPILDMNSGYVTASTMPSFVLPERRPEDHSFHSTLSPSPMSWFPEERWQCIMSDPVVPICASTSLPGDYPLYDPAMSGLGILDVPETMEDLARANACETGVLWSQTQVPRISASLSEASMQDVNSGYGSTKDGMIKAGTSLCKLRSACDNCYLAKIKCSRGQPCERCHGLKTNCYYGVQKPRNRYRKTKYTTGFPCLFEQCDRAASEEAFSSKWNCYDHMKRVHGYAEHYEDFKSRTSAVVHQL